MELSLHVQWRLGLEHSTFYLRSETSNRLRHRRGCNVGIDALRDKEQNPNAIMLKDRIFWLVCFEFFIPLENYSYGDNIPEYAFDVVRLQVVVCT